MTFSDDFYKVGEIDHDYGSCGTCGHSILHHKFSGFGTWFINLFRGGYKKNAGYCKAPNCKCKKGWTP